VTDLKIDLSVYRVSVKAYVPAREGRDQSPASLAHQIVVKRIKRDAHEPSWKPYAAVAQVETKHIAVDRTVGRRPVWVGLIDRIFQRPRIVPPTADRCPRDTRDLRDLEKGKAGSNHVEHLSASLDVV